MKTVKGPARLTHRQRQALATRDLILDTARQLFRARGYAGTTMEAIAAGAGVAVNTIYASFGTKRSILTAIRLRWLEQAEVPRLDAEANSEPDPARRFALMARLFRQQYESGLDIVLAIFSAAEVDPEVKAELKPVASERAARLERVVKGLRGGIRPGLTIRRAAGLLRALVQANIYQELVVRSGWSPDDYERWLAATLMEQIVGEAPARST